jgi:hypothetical protein
LEVSVELDYIVSGLVDLDNLPDDVSDSEVEAIMQEIIANTLGVHSSDIIVAFDSSTGGLTYAVINDDDNIANGIQQALDSSTFEEQFITKITNILPSVTVTSMSTEDEIEMNVVVTIDATESIIDIEKARRKDKLDPNQFLNINIYRHIYLLFCQLYTLDLRLKKITIK